jgi:two-component system C4-dicarboxylate transport response regulator DctD
VATRLLGRSAVMARLRDSLRAVAATEADVLIQGETGTGKSIAAHTLHDISARSHRPFVGVNCAALPTALIENELFGHEAGAFPGATRPRYGKFEHARGGTLFLDEIDSLPMALQGKLLHAIEHREITRLGANDPIALDLRIIAAAKGDLLAAVRAGQFRADLLYRLNVVTLRLPSLAERREDIAILFTALLETAAARAGKRPPPVPGAVLAALTTRDWPGNIRELRNTAERMALGLDPDVADQGGAQMGANQGGAQDSLAAQLAAHERALIAAALAANGGSIKATYTALQLSRKALYEKMQRHGLTREQFRDGAADVSKT